jgi:glyoxylase-like metal-dependent hydrolase (beta-lactamase superfamily II)
MQSVNQLTSSRRVLLQSAGRLAGAALFLPAHLAAANKGIVPTLVDAAAKAKIEVIPVRRNLSILDGSGGNISVLTGKDGTLLVDSGFSVSQSAIQNALASIQAPPVKRLINTHWHTDHTDGNAWLNQSGAQILAHENTRKRLSVATRVEGWQWTFPPAPPGAIPTTVFQNEHTLRHNDTKLALKYYGPAHTDSDIWVHFVEADVVHLGDTWWNGFYPFIDYSTGGSIDGQIRAAEVNVAHFTDKTIFIPGHGPVGKRSDLVQFRDMLQTIRAKVAALKKRGMTLDQVIAAKPTAQFDAKWGQFVISPANFTGLVFAGV